MKSKVSEEYDGKPRKLYQDFCRCGKEFWTPKHLLGKRKYCSRKCKALDSRDRISVICAFCEKSFLMQRSKLGKSKSGLVFCCREHKDKAQSLEFGILKPPHYTTLDTTKDYRKKMEMATAPEDYVCQNPDCPITKAGIEIPRYMLAIHHIDKNRNNNDLDNLIILCAWCHSQVHRRVIP